jgi:hypothetical protein
VCQIFRFVQITRTWSTLWQWKAYRVTNEMISHIVMIQLLHIIFVEKSEWENRHFVKTWARYADRCLRWQSTALYNTNTTLWDVVQVYTGCLNDSSKYIELSACTRSRSVWWDHRSWADVSKDWSKRWVIWWALSSNSRTTEILFYHSESKMFITECFLSNEEKLLFCERHWVLISESLYTELIQYTHDLTMTEHSKRNVTDVLLLRQFFWLRMLQNVCTFCRNCDKCCMNNSWKNCQQGFLKPLPVLKRIWQKIFIDFVVNLLSSESCTNLLMITELSQQESDTEIMQRDDCRMSDSDIHTTFLLSSWAFITIVSDWETQFVSSLKKNLSAIEDYTENVHSLSLRNWWGDRIYESECWTLHCTFFNYSQDNWANLLLMTELIINNHDSVFTEVSLFFLSHKYHMKLLQLFEKLRLIQSAKSSVQKANQIVQKMKKVTEWAQMIMTVAQQMQKRWSIERDSSYTTSRKKTKSD